MGNTMDYIFKKLGRFETNLAKMDKSLRKSSKYLGIASICMIGLIWMQSEDIKRLQKRVSDLEEQKFERYDDWFEKNISNPPEEEVEQ